MLYIHPYPQPTDTTRAFPEERHHISLTRSGPLQYFCSSKFFKPITTSCTQGAIQTNKICCNPVSGSPTDGVTTNLLDRVDQVSVSYNAAGWRELHNCSLALKDNLERPWDDQTSYNRDEDQLRSGNCKMVPVSDQIHRLLKRGQQGAERAVLILRETALKEQDGKSLQQCINLMSEGLYIHKDMKGAINLLHKFLTHGTGRRSNQEIVDRAKISATPAIQSASKLWSAEDERYNLFQILRLSCAKIVGMSNVDNLSIGQLEWLLSMLRIRVLRHRERSAILFLAQAEQDLWKTKVSTSRHEHHSMARSRHVTEGVDAYLGSCAIYERAIQESEGKVSQSEILNDYGLQLKNGITGMYQNAPKAERLYEKAIDAGNAAAMYNLACMLEKGAEGVDKDLQRAVQLFERAIDAGNTDAMNSFALTLKSGSEGVANDPQRAVQLCQHAINAENTEAMIVLAFMLRNEAGGVDKDPQRAVHLYQRAIDQEQDITVTSNLEYMFYYGFGEIQLDLQRAKDLYQQAIEVGNDSRSIYHLGCLLQHADNAVIQKDEPKAKELYERSIVESNDVDAKFALAKLLEAGDEGVTREPNRAVELYQSLVVDHQHEEGLKRVSKFPENVLEESHGFEADGRVVEVYEKAMQGKLEKIACGMLGELLHRGCAGVSVNEEREAQLLGDVGDKDKIGEKDK